MTALFETIRREEIPHSVLDKLRYSENLALARPQGKDACGLNSVRSMLLCGHNYGLDEEELAEIMRALSGRSVEGNGIGPEDIAKLFHHVDKSLGAGLKVFMTCGGDADQLRYLTDRHLPVMIHRVVRERGERPDHKPRLHYEFLVGLDEECVYVCNSSVGSPSSGFYKVSVPSFMDEWWPVAGGDGAERWYLTAIGRETSLPRQMFKGKYC